MAQHSFSNVTSRPWPAGRCWLAVILATVLALSIQPQPAAAAPADTPTPVVADDVEVWSAGAGLVYWGSNCFADEFNPFAVLKRKPAAGGAERTLESINDTARCITHLSQLSTGSGLFYYDYSQGRIERMPLGEPYTPKVVKALDPNLAPSGRALLLAGNFLYWTNGFDKVLRVRADGSGDVQTVANANIAVTDVLVVGTVAYYTDRSGVWSISIDCATLPCGAPTQFAEFGTGTFGYGLLHQPIGGVRGDYRLYWVQQSGNAPNTSFQIRYRACDQLTVCAVAPLPPAETFYGSTANWRIGNPLLAGGNLYWTELDQGNANNGDVKRRAANAAQPGADTLATSQPKIDDQLYAVNGALFFARQNTGIYSLPLDASAIVRDFGLEGVEVTQGIQNLANAAPLVAQKTTYVRAYARQLAGPSAANVETSLAGERNGVALPGSPLAAIHHVRALTTGGGFDRARLQDGWYFLLPASWTSGGPITLRATVDPRQIHSDPNRDNNALAVSANFQSQPPVCVWTVPVRTHSPRPSTKDPNFWSMVSHFNRRWPVPDTWIFRDTDPVEELQVCWGLIFPYPCYGPYELSDGWGITNGPPDRDKVITSLWGRALLSFNPDACDDIGAPVHFMGMVHPKADNGGMSGYASLISKQSWVQLPNHTPNPVPSTWNALREGSVMAQELAHNYGRRHVDCGSPDDIDGSYPYPPCQIANTGADSYYGFDTVTLQPIRPDQTADFMSYAGRSWVSDYTWRSLLGKFLAVVGVQSASSALPAADGPLSVFVTGLVDTSNPRGQIAQLLLLPTASLPPATLQTMQVQTMQVQTMQVQTMQVQAANLQAGRLQAAGAQHDTPAAVYKLRLLDANSQVLAERTLTLTPLDDHSAESSSSLFTDLFAPPAGTVAAVQLLADNTLLDQRTPGTSTPQVTIVQPAAGAVISDSMTIQWSATDADVGDALLLTVQYSHDNGASWHTLALDLPAGPTPANSLVLADLGSLHGSAADAARIRILASDGYNTGSALSAPFTLQDRPPLPVILSPAESQTVAAGETVILQGSATDPEDGGLPPTALAWQVDGSGAGSGPGGTAAGLAPGAHTATLFATDSSGKTATAAAAFAVAPLDVADGAAPLLDGLCEDPAYAAADSLPLRPYDAQSQGSVRLLHSGGDLWVCFWGLKPGATDPGSFAGLRADVDNSRGGAAQPADIGFFAGEDGDVYTLLGDGSGGWTAGDGAGLQAQVSAGAGAWSAELRIDQAQLGGWNHLAGLALGHHSVMAAGDDFTWPYPAGWAVPNSWAAAVLGSQPVIAALDPFTVAVQGPAFTLQVTGSGFVSGTQLLWNGAALPTSFIDAAHLAAAVGPGQLAASGPVQVIAQAPAPGGVQSNAAILLVEAAAPVIGSVSPAAVPAGSATQTLTVNGSGFAAGAELLWNGEPLPAQVVASTQLRVQVSAALLAVGQSAGLAVRNPAPGEGISNSVTFEVTPARNQSLYLPLMLR